MLSIRVLTLLVRVCVCVCVTFITQIQNMNIPLHKCPPWDERVGILEYLQSIENEHPDLIRHLKQNGISIATPTELMLVCDAMFIQVDE
jgi:hypothetical protein